MADKPPYGISRGEEMGRGSQKKWNRGKYRKQAEAMESRHQHDANQTKESNIRETQARLKNRAAVDSYSKRKGSKRMKSGRKSSR